METTIRNERVVVMRHSGMLVLIRDQTKPMPEMDWGWSRRFETPNREILPATRAGRNAYTDGITVVRQGKHGWYIRTGECEDPYIADRLISSSPLNKMPPHIAGIMVEETVTPWGMGTQFLCPWCAEERDIDM